MCVFPLKVRTFLWHLKIFTNSSFFFAQENGSLWKSQVNTEERACPHPTCENLDFSITVIDISFMTPTLFCSVL